MYHSRSQHLLHDLWEPLREHKLKEKHPLPFQNNDRQSVKSRAVLLLRAGQLDAATLGIMILTHKQIDAFVRTKEAW